MLVPSDISADSMRSSSNPRLVNYHVTSHKERLFVWNFWSCQVFDHRCAKLDKMELVGMQLTFEAREHFNFFSFGGTGKSAKELPICREIVQIY